VTGIIKKGYAKKEKILKREGNQFKNEGSRK